MDEFEVFNESLNDELDTISQVDIKELAIASAISFFENKEYECGGPIPRRELLRKTNILGILEFTPSHRFIDGLALLHEILDQNDPPSEGFEGSKLVDWRIQFLTELLAESSMSGVPKSFAIGITLMNLQYCYGITKWRIWS